MNFFSRLCVRKKKNVGKTRLRPGFCRKKFSKKNGARLLRTPILLKFSRIAPSKRFMCTIDFFSEKRPLRPGFLPKKKNLKLAHVFCVRQFCTKFSRIATNMCTIFIFLETKPNTVYYFCQQKCLFFFKKMKLLKNLCVLFLLETRRVRQTETNFFSQKMTFF